MTASLLVACAPGADATEPDITASPTQEVSTGARQPVPTSTPWPNFGPPPVTLADLTPTIQEAPDEPLDEIEVEVTPTPTVPASPSSTLVGTRVVPDQRASHLDFSGTFTPNLAYDYSVPDGWWTAIGDDEIVLMHPQGDAVVSLRERQVDRLKFPSVSQLAAVMEPYPFVDWSERALSDLSTSGTSSMSFHYSGTRLGRPFVTVVDWYLWGDMLVEVTTEVEAQAWSANSKLRNEALISAASFLPDPEVPHRTKFEIKDLLHVVFGHRRSGVFSAAVGDPLRTELSCREVFHNLLSEPVYSGSGAWQVFAIGDQGAQVWHVYEPHLSIEPAAHNTSVC